MKTSPAFIQQHIAAACCLLASVCAHSSEDSDINALPVVSVSGSRSAINPNTPAATDSIDRSRLADLNIANP